MKEVGNVSSQLWGWRRMTQNREIMEEKDKTLQPLENGTHLRGKEKNAKAEDGALGRHICDTFGSQRGNWNVKLRKKY